MLQEDHCQGRQCRTTSPRLYGNTGWRLEIGMAPVAVTTLNAPPPLTAVGADLYFHVRLPPMMSTAKVLFNH